MCADVEKSVWEKLHISGKFALQLDESTDIGGRAQRLASVCFGGGDSIREDFLFCLREKEERKYFQLYQTALTKKS